MITVDIIDESEVQPLKPKETFLMTLREEVNGVIFMDPVEYFCANEPGK